MSTHDAQREQKSEAPVAEPAAPAGPASDLEQLASLVGNNAFARLVSRQAVPPPAGGPRSGEASREALARSLQRLSTQAPLAVARQDEEEDPGLSDGQKDRLADMAIAPIRNAAGQLKAGEKANVKSIVRHLKPVQGVLRGFAAKGETKATIASQGEQLSAVITVLESLNLSQKQVIFLTRSSWQTARRHLAATKAELRRLGHPPRGQTPPPPNDVRAFDEGVAHLEALSQQIQAYTQDLHEAPRTQEGFKQVMEQAAQVLEQFESFTSAGGQVPAAFAQAKAAFVEGLVRLAPIAMGKEAAIKECESSLTEIANALAPLAGEDVVEPEPPPEETKPPPAPSPNPLPPPPPPPPGSTGPPTDAGVPTPAGVTP